MMKIFACKRLLLSCMVALPLMAPATQAAERLVDDPEYREAVRLLDERTIDFAESHLHALIKDKNPAATIFFLKTKGKNRGYVERQEVEVNERKALSWTVLGNEAGENVL